MSSEEPKGSRSGADACRPGMTVSSSAIMPTTMDPASAGFHRQLVVGPRTVVRRSPVLALLERGHRQTRVVELLPVQLGGLLVARPDDRPAGVVDLVGERVAAGHADAGDRACQRVRDV